MSIASVFSPAFNVWLGLGSHLDLGFVVCFASPSLELAIKSRQRSYKNKLNAPHLTMVYSSVATSRVSRWMIFFFFFFPL